MTNTPTPRFKVGDVIRCGCAGCKTWHPDEPIMGTITEIIPSAIQGAPAYYQLESENDTITENYAELIEAAP